MKKVTRGHIKRNIKASIRVGYNIFIIKCVKYNYYRHLRIHYYKK